MKKLHAICAAALLAGAIFGQTGAGERDRFVGGWKLVSIENPGAGKVECCGLFVFTRDGHLSVQVMQPGSSASNAYSQDGYEATYGIYQINERAHTFTFHVEGSLVRDLVGKDLPRRFEFSGKRLIVTSTDPNEHWKVTWERY